MSGAGSDSPKGVRRAFRRLLLTGASTFAIVTAITVMPKDPARAAPTRFYLTIALLGVVIAGATMVARAFKKWRRARRNVRFQKAPAAARDVFSHLDYESQLAWKGARPCFFAAYSAFALYIIAHWPQARPLAPYRDAFGVGAIIFMALVPLIALRNRAHFINRHFLNRYLRQQLTHVEFKPARLPSPMMALKAPPPFKVTGPLRFEIDGVEFSFDDFTANVGIFGQTGSGKTICVLNIFLDALLASSIGTDFVLGGLILDAKGDFHGKLATLCARYGRADDLVVIDPEAWAEHAETFASIAWNPIEEDPASEVAARLVAVCKMLGLATGNEGSFFLDSAKTFLRHAIELVRAAQLTPAPSIVDVHRLCQESEDETPLYHAILEAISVRYPGAIPTQVQEAIQYLETEWRRMSHGQKSGVVGTLTQLLDQFLVEPYREIFTRPSTISMSRCLDENKIVYVHMPIAKGERISRVVDAMVKVEHARQVLRRRGKKNPTIFMSDEYQTIFTSGEDYGDANTFERSRESFHANIVASQNLEAFFRRVPNEHEIKNFLSNCAVKLFLRNTDEATNTWASRLFSMRSEFVITANEQAEAHSGLGRRRHTSFGRASRTMPKISADRFMALAIPRKDDPERQHADSIIHVGSRGDVEHLEIAWPVHPLE